VQLLVNSLHDAHVTLAAGALSAFSFGSPYSISSASVDGKQPPQVYITGTALTCLRNLGSPTHKKRRRHHREPAGRLAAISDCVH
jgi:hypothetical protein